MLDLTCPPFQIFIGSYDISLHVTGFSFRHPLSEPSTPLVWTGQVELDLTIDTDLGVNFFDDEVNPQIWLSGLQPIDVYFNGTWWQRFRIKPSGYRYDQVTGQAVAELTDIIGILDSYQPSADAPDFKTGGNNYWNTLAVALINKQASLMGISVTVQTPDYGIGGIYRVPRSVSGSYIKEAQKMAGERGQWMWCDKEVIKWAAYPQTADNIVWQKSRKELLNFIRQQGLDPIKTKVTVSATHEDIDDCNNVYPQTTYSYVSANVATGTTGIATTQAYRLLSAITTRDRIITGNNIYNFTTKTFGNPALALFGGQVDNGGKVTVNIPNAVGYTITKNGGYDWWLQYKKSGASFNVNWQNFSSILDQTDVTTYENIPYDSQNPSKILKRVVTKSEPWAKFPDGLQYFGVGEWLVVDVNNVRRITERTTTTYTYVEVFRTDIIVQVGQKLYEIQEIDEIKEQVYFYKNKVSSTLTTVTPLLVPNARTYTQYTKICQGRWKERKIVQQNQGQSSTSFGYLFGVQDTEDFVTAIPDITYRPPAYPVKQKPLLGSAITGYTSVSPYVNSNEFVSASTLTTTAECIAHAAHLGKLKYQRYFGRELASGFGTVLSFTPFQGVYAGNGAYIRDRFGVSLNREGESWQFVEDCIGNKVASIPEIASPNYPYPPLLTSALNIGAIPDQTYVQGIPIASITFISAGGQQPYTYSSTSLPAGLSLSSSGVLSGTPTAIASTSVTVTVTDSVSATSPTSFSISVVAATIPLSIVSQTYVFDGSWQELGEMSLNNGIPIDFSLSATWQEYGEMIVRGGGIGNSDSKSTSLRAIETGQAIGTIVTSGFASGKQRSSKATEKGSGQRTFVGSASGSEKSKKAIQSSAAIHPSIGSAYVVEVSRRSTESGGVVYVDPDVYAVITAILATGVTLSTTQRSAINDRIVNAKSDGVWTKLIAYYGFVGGTAASHAINWKNPSAYTIAWNGTLTHNANGVKGDGSTGYGDTGINPNTLLSRDSCGLGFYLTQSKTSTTSYESGSSDGTNTLCLEIYSGIAYFENGASYVNTSNSGAKQYLSGNKAGTTTAKLYSNGSIIATNTISSAILPNGNIFVFAYRTSSGTPRALSAARLGSLVVNTGLTDAEETANYVSELAFQTALSRN